jgi:hypothetical protein
LSSPQAASYVIEQVQVGNFPIQIIDHSFVTTTMTHFHPHGSKQNTLFDAIVASTVKQLNAQAIFSFDQWYRKQGLMLARDLVEEQKQAV